MIYKKRYLLANETAIRNHPRHFTKGKVYTATYDDVNKRYEYLTDRDTDLSIHIDTSTGLLEDSYMYETKRELTVGGKLL